MSKLSNTQINKTIIAAISGMKKTKIARAMNRHPDTIRRVLKNHPERMAMFQRDGDTFKLPKDAVLRLNGQLIVSKLILTGKPEDGVVYCSEVYQTGYNGDTGDDEVPFVEQDLSDWFLDTSNVGVIAPLTIGFLFADEVDMDLIASPYYANLENDKDIPDDLGMWAVEIQEQKPVPALVEKPKQETKPIWNASNRFVSITNGRKVYNATSEHKHFKEIVAACIAEDFDTAIEKINVEMAIKRFTQGNVEIKDGELYYKGVLIRSGLTRRIIEAMENKKDFKFFLPFLENLMLNPSNTAVYSLFDFLEANDIAITKDGYFIAWKKVDANFKDIRTGNFDNSVGKVVKEDRFLVDEDRNVTCSRGLHVCSKAYLPHYANAKSNIVVKVKVNPRDVVAIPTDYNNAKLRCCEYKVVAVA